LKKQPVHPLISTLYNPFFCTVGVAINSSHVSDMSRFESRLGHRLR